MDSKVCIGCGEQKPLQAFYSTTRKNKPGRIEYSSRCRPCHAIQQKPLIGKPPKNPRSTAEERFLGHVVKDGEDGCWVWKAGCNSDGRPTFFGSAGHPVLAQRFAWEMVNGPLPARMPVRSTCGYAVCVRPSHLTLARWKRYDPATATKRCTVCLLWLPVKEFSSKLSKAGYTYGSRCKTCNSEYQRAHKFGLSLPDFQAMAQAQGNRCSICHRTPQEVSRRPLVVDHDHRTGALRSLLCGPCNSTIGLLGEDPERMRSMIAYLEHWNAQPIEAVCTPKMNRATVA